MISEGVVELSSWQIIITSLFHFLFVPLTLGLSFILAIMESIYVITGREIYKDMTQFWGKLFGINFVVSVATGLILMFQVGMNWSYFAHYVGDVFALPLVFEGLMAVFMETTFVGLFFFGWDKLSKRQHLVITWLVALAASFSALWLLVMNGWMHNSVGAVFNYQTMRMEVSHFAAIIFNPVAQIKFIHTVAAGYATSAAFVLGISAYYMLKGRDAAFSQRSFTIAAGFGLAATLSLMLIGDEGGYTEGMVQKTKLAAINAEWHTAETPAAFTVLGLPNQENKETESAIEIPWLLGLMATQSVDTPIMGLTEIMEINQLRIRQGMKAYGLLEALQSGNKDQDLIAEFEIIKQDLGYGLLLKRYTDRIVDATDAQIESAVKDSIPQVTTLFWMFRVMLVSGLIMLLVFTLAMLTCSTEQYRKDWLLKLCLYTMPLPWIASEAGWLVSEFGRQPWAVAEVLPTFLAASSLSEWHVIFSLAGYAILYSVFLVLEILLMMRYIKQGPSSLHKRRYHFELDERGAL
ncbi:MAG: cytochrome ubiquinol oxidase subunit I [Methylococcales bacterium]|nr:cytochrome ubiquinol oxidase subunit I [Methylococcales bacterium]